MNEIKKQLLEKIDCLKLGNPLIYEHKNGTVFRRYLIMSGEKIAPENFSYFTKKCCNPTLLVSDEFLRKNKLHNLCRRDECVVNCDFSYDGFQKMVNSLANGKEPEGNDRLILKIVKSTQILTDQNPEARIMEFMSNIDKTDGILLYGLLLDGVKVNNIMTINTENVLLSRFFNPRLIEFTGVIEVDLIQGKFALHSFYSEIDRRYHWAFVKNDGDSQKIPLIRIESECLTGHVFGSLLCDCGEQLSRGLAEVAKYGRGALVYLRQEGRGIGLKAKLEAYYLQQVHGMDTVDANLAVGMPEDARDYLIGAQILNHLGFQTINLMTNNPTKIAGITKYGIKVDQQVAHIIPPSQHNKRYLETKKSRMGHKI